MESGTITDGQITASSELSSDHIASFARLNRVKEGHRGGSWSAKTNDVNQWLQIELGSEYTNVTRVATQGRSDLDQWVETYKLQYSDDGVNYQLVQGNKEQQKTRLCKTLACESQASIIYPSIKAFHDLYLPYSETPQL